MATKCCMMHSPPMFRCVRFNPRRISAAKAKEQLEELIAQQFGDCEKPIPSVSELTLSPELLLLEGRKQDPPSLSEKQLYLYGIASTELLRGSVLLSPGVNGFYPEFSKGDLVSVFANIKTGFKQPGLSKLKESKKIFLGNAAILQSREQLWPEEFSLKEEFSDQIVKWSEPIWLMPTFKDCIVRDWGVSSSIPDALAPLILDPKHNEDVLGVRCNGPLLQHLALQVNDASRLVTLHRSLSSLKWSGWRSLRIGVEREESRFENLNSEEERKFDKILLSPDCSETGKRCNFFVPQFRSQPEIRARTAEQQTKLLNSSASLLKPGGTLLYYVGSLRRQEGPDIIADFLRRNPNFKAIAQPKSLLIGETLLDQQRDDYWESILELGIIEPKSMQRIDPRKYCTQCSPDYGSKSMFPCKSGRVWTYRKLWREKQRETALDWKADIDGAFFALIQKE